MNPIIDKKVTVYPSTKCPHTTPMIANGIADMTMSG